MKNYAYLLVLLMLAVVSCRSEKKASQTPDSFSLEEIWRTDTTLMTPESVIFDSKRDVLYVSNLNFEPRKKDGNGFISILSLEGEILNLRWIEGISSPKGMAISGDTLFTADVDELVLMDINKGEIIRKIPIPGAGMLNDLTSDGKGNIYISDTDANKIHVYSGGVIREWLTEGLLGPNGLYAEGERLLVASQGSSDFAAIRYEDHSRELLADSVGRGDGIARISEEGHYIVTDWSGEIFLVAPGKFRTSLLSTKEAGSNTADIEFLADKKILLVPTFFKNSIVAYSLKEVVTGKK